MVGSTPTFAPDGRPDSCARKEPADELYSDWLTVEAVMALFKAQPAIALGAAER